MRETAKRVKHIFVPLIKLFFNNNNKKNINHYWLQLLFVCANPAYKMILSCNIMFMKDIIKSCMKPWFSIYPWRGVRKINVREIVCAKIECARKKMLKIWSWAKIKWIKILSLLVYKNRSFTFKSSFCFSGLTTDIDICMNVYQDAWRELISNLDFSFFNVCFSPGFLCQ